MLDTIRIAAEKSGCTVIPNAPMSQYTTFRVGGPADLLVEPDSEEALSAVLKACKEEGITPLVIGKGSNLLVPDEGLKGVVIHLGERFGTMTALEDGKVEVKAGASMIKLCRFCLEQSLSGLEFAFGIPGTVGGAIYMNAGAYGGETGEWVCEVRHMDMDGNAGVWTAEEAGFSYRHSNYMGSGLIVTSAVFRLKSDKAEDIKARMDDYMTRRRTKQPLEYPSAGSTFKRPEGYFAGALIEQSGLKGASVGGAQVSEKHAGFVINKDNATAKDILNLMAHVRETVYNDHGVTLEPEVRILGAAPWNS